MESVVVDAAFSGEFVGYTYFLGLEILEARRAWVNFLTVWLGLCLVRARKHLEH